jgi:hypothetical protein
MDRREQRLHQVLLIILTLTSAAASHRMDRSLNALADAGAKLNVPNRLGICPVDAATGAALTWLEDRGFRADQGMVFPHSNASSEMCYFKTPFIVSGSAAAAARSFRARSN